MKIWATIRDIMLLMVRVLAIIALSVLGYKTGCYPGAPEKRPEPDTLRINSLADQIDLLEQDKPVSDSIARIIIGLAEEGIDITVKPYTYYGTPCMYFQDKRARYAYQIGDPKATKYTDQLIDRAKRYPGLFTNDYHLWIPFKGGDVAGYYNEFFTDPLYLRYKELVVARKYKKAMRILDLLSSETTDPENYKDDPYYRISDSLVVHDWDYNELMAYAKYDLASISENARLRCLMGDDDAHKWMEGAYLTGALYLSPQTGMLATTEGYEKKASEFFRQLTPYMVINYNNEDPAWVYNTALLVKGSSAIMPAGVRKGTFKEEIFQSYKDIQERLNPDECAIEIVKTPGLKGDDMYKAVILKSGGEEPVMVELGPAPIINDIVSSGRTYSADGLMFNHIWAPMMPHLEDVSKIYLSADGVLCLIDLARIADQNGMTAFDQVEIVNCISTKDICIAHQSSQSKDIVLFGGLTYSPEVAKENEWYAQFDYLPGTLEEVNSVVDMAKKQGFNTTLYTADTGTKAAFESLDGKALKVLHIATHGFYYTRQRAHNITFFDQMADDNDPLNRCGLLLSDGPILGSDIARMDFSGVDVVILSACNTGLGDVTSEGVAGLQKAFRQAGVWNVVMSLGAINDNSLGTMLGIYGRIINLEGFQVTPGIIMIQYFVKNLTII